MQQSMATVVSDDEATHIIRRGNEYYWQKKPDGKEYGPFATLLEAEDDIQFREDMIEVCESLAEAEGEIGIACWIDPETGFPAEMHIPRIEEH